ncbi:MAG: DNA translocase FtsK [Clostridiaceae bacterium]|nr:DNA translocase FtsK [Clostridiaceae bacterium]
MANKKIIKDNSLNLKGEITGVCFITFGVLMILSIFMATSLGIIGKVLNNILFSLVGLGAFFFPFLIIFIGIGYIANKGRLRFGKRFLGIIILLIDFLLFIQILNMSKYYIDGKISVGITAITTSTSNFHGGIIGFLISIPLYKLFGSIGCYLIFLSLFIISMILVLEISLYNTASKMKIKNLDKKVTKKVAIDEKIPDENRDSYIKSLNKKIKILDLMKKGIDTDVVEGNDVKVEPVSELIERKTPFIVEQRIPEQRIPEKRIPEKTPEVEIEKELEIEIEKQSSHITDIYEFPISDLLNINNLSKLNKDDKRDLISNASKLEETLRSFGVEAKVVQVTKGPSVTRFELQPNAGVKVSKIVNLSDDIALSLAASGVRIEAPIPGKAAIGIEVPNKELTAVFLREVIESTEFISSKKNLAFCLGKDIAGNCVVSDLSRMPHVLIAGATGSGKSVCINTLIISLLYKYSPEEVKLLMIDPKVVELSTFNGIPHLLIPVVTDPKKAAGALSWAVNEMTKRYKLFAENNVRNIESYNELFNKGRIHEKLPFIVIIIDELADLMMVCANDVEEYIGRLAQMARAAGMHLVIATQRPSVDVITGVIKANIPSRISFAVSSQIDSRTILDMAGAEKLLGKGDMLFFPVGESKPLRIQGAFISEEEVEKVVEAIKKQEKKVEYSEKIIEEINTSAMSSNSNQEDSDLDELLEDAIKIVIDAGQASTSLLQRRLRIGYNRAARLVEQLEEQGIISPRDGGKPRQILISKQE